MQVRLLLGAAGSGKTFRCLSEARQALLKSPEGLPLVLVAPRQGTYQLEQRLLADPSLVGFTRLSILSFESLARFIFAGLKKPFPKPLSEEGRLMVLRGLLAEKRENLKVFRASARLTGFAQELSHVLSEVQRAQLTPEALRQLAGCVVGNEGLAHKLEDLATLLGHYVNWLGAHDLQDEDALLRATIKLLEVAAPCGFQVEKLWVDGFAEFSELELDLLCALIPYCRNTTVTFCLDAPPPLKRSWLSHWSMVIHSLSRCRARLAGLTDVEVITETLPRSDNASRFVKNPVLQHLEQRWETPTAYHNSTAPILMHPPKDLASDVRSAGTEPTEDESGTTPGDTLRVVSCLNREAEVTLAAREIIAFVRAGARYREVSLLVRNLDPYYQIIQQVFQRYQIPFFLDRRESVSHHPVAELTRSAIRVVTLGWRQEDWFAALKSGLFTLRDDEIDLLENEALARGWKGQAWLQPIRLKQIPRTTQEKDHLTRLEKQLEEIRRQLVPPFEQFIVALSVFRNRPTGPQLASAIRNFWKSLQVEERLQKLTAVEASSATDPNGLSVHETVWRQVNAWLDNAELAFANEPLALREWIPILEASLSNLTVGIIPPALDQVLVGAVDRSRTPEVRLAIVLGLNETVFPSKPKAGCLLTESDRLELEKRDIVLGSTARRHLGREKYLAYIACTRARQRLLLTSASQDATGAQLNPSSFLSHLLRLFPALKPEVAAPGLVWNDAQHPVELSAMLAKSKYTEVADQRSEAGILDNAIRSVPGLAAFVKSVHGNFKLQDSESLKPEVAARLYGPVLRTSVSRMEHFAACPFKFFVHSGLRAEERKLFELDAREQGTFQHDVLALFHQQLRAEGKRWRDISPAEARERVGRLAQRLVGGFREGLFEASDQSRFTARVLGESLQDFIETVVGWMLSQYRFDPTEVELPFGEEGGNPAWKLDLGNGMQLELYGRIDRLDFYHVPGSQRALCVVIDYKSSQKQLDPVLVLHGVQLQLLTYLNVVRQWPKTGGTFGAAQLDPAGVFYVNLKGSYSRERNRVEALADPERSRREAYRHYGRFDVRALPQLDGRSEVKEGDQFNYRLTKSGRVNKACREALDASKFDDLLSQVQNQLRTMGQQIYAGRAEVEPYRKGAATACEQCTYQAICRIDPWTHRFRVLRRVAGDEVPTPDGQSGNEGK